MDKFTGAAEQETETGSDMAATSGGKLAYVNSDSLLAHYNYYEEVAAALQEKRSSMESDYNRRAQALQGQVDDYQRTYLNMTVPQARAVEEDLMNKRQELAVFQESVRQELMREEAEITTILYENVSKYLKQYGDENGLEIVFTFTPGSGLLYANEALDITDIVIESLNEEYLDSKAAVESGSIEE